MAFDDSRPRRPGGPVPAGAPSSSPGLADVVAAADRLVRTPSADRDLRWHVAAAYIGDISALATAGLRAS